MSDYKERVALPKGDTAEAKLVNIISRYQKIIEDCKDDPEPYRKQFAKCHVDVIANLTADDFSRIKLEKLVKSVGMNAAFIECGVKNNFRAAINSASQNGEMDASKLIEIELSHILDSHVYF